MFYYAVVNEKDIVVNIESLEESVDYFEYIPITSEDWSLCDKWYDRNGKYGTVGAFIDPPISVLAAHCTGEISYKDEDVWLDEKLDSYATQSSLNSGLATKASLNHNHSASAITETDSQKIMTAAERTKLSGIAENANNYIHPENHPASMITGLSNVATSGDYADLTNKPTIPEAYTHPASHPASMISGLASVATSGSYDDLTDKPSIPTIPASLPANGGNADTVDGYHAAAFAQTQHNHDLVYSNLDHTHSNYADVDHTHSTYANSSHTHAQSDISGLSIALNAKANASHTHAQNEITNLEAALAGKASTSHNHDSAYSAISHTHSAASTTAAGFMSAADKTKLNGIATGANAYTHPSTHAASMITGLASVATSGSYADLTNKPSTFTPASHTHAQSEITGLSTALSSKAPSTHNHDLAYISKNLQFTNDDGSFKIAYTTADNKNILTEIASYAIGVYTVYSQAAVQGNPKATEAWRLLVHKTGSSVGWVQAYGSYGSVYTNYLDGTSGWRGWKCIWDNAPSPLWSGTLYMNANHIVTPSKKLSECRIGYVLVWSDYDHDTSTVNDIDFVNTVIYKSTPTGEEWNGQTHFCDIPIYLGSNTSDTSTETRVIKKLKVYNNKIVGVSENALEYRREAVLRAVWEI